MSLDEAEPLLRVFLADQGSRADTLATLAATRAWAEERHVGNLAAARAFLTLGWKTPAEGLDEHLRRRYAGALGLDPGSRR